MLKFPRNHNIMKNQYIELAKHLYELEGESISNDPKGHFMVNDWYEKYGQDSDKFANDITVKEEDVQALAKEIEEDFNSGFWEGKVEYYPLMTSIYNLSSAFEKSLASLVGIGYQTELFS